MDGEPASLAKNLIERLEEIEVIKEILLCDSKSMSPVLSQALLRRLNQVQRQICRDYWVPILSIVIDEDFFVMLKSIRPKITDADRSVGLPVSP